jgi:hypothetical protein
MNFTTKIPIAKSGSPIGYDSGVLSLGSCFAENIGAKFSYFKFQNAVNPFGIIFNPVSIEKLVDKAVHKQNFTEQDIFFHNDSWHCYDVHSQLSHPGKEDFLKNLNDLIESAHSQITKSTHIIITYGTSWVYRNKASGNIVANCHKVPQSRFDKEILSVETIEKSIQNTIGLVQRLNADCKFIFTISPVRHIKDGFLENAVSKSHLLSAIYKTITNKHAAVNYFPAYEIMMDELRDYRFYAEDMLHPSQTAIDYIWERFFENYISEACFTTMEEISSIRKALAHKPFNPGSDSHQKFLANLQGKIDTLQQQFPHFVF